jgi:hypothetical protein
MSNTRRRHIPSRRVDQLPIGACQGRLLVMAMPAVGRINRFRIARDPCANARRLDGGDHPLTQLRVLPFDE